MTLNIATDRVESAMNTALRTTDMNDRLNRFEKLAQIVTLPPDQSHWPTVIAVLLHFSCFARAHVDCLLSETMSGSGVPLGGSSAYNAYGAGGIGSGFGMPRPAAPQNKKTAAQPSKPSKQQLLDDDDEIADDAEDYDNFANVSTRNLETLGLLAHPSPACEAASLSSVPSPDCDYAVKLPSRVLQSESYSYFKPVGQLPSGTGPPGQVQCWQQQMCDISRAAWLAAAQTVVSGVAQTSLTASRSAAVLP